MRALVVADVFHENVLHACSSRWLRHRQENYNVRTAPTSENSIQIQKGSRKVDTLRENQPFRKMDIPTISFSFLDPLVHPPRACDSILFEHAAVLDQILPN